MKGNNTSYVEKTNTQHNEKIINENNLITEQWIDEQLDIFTDIILAALIKESQKDNYDEDSEI